MSKPYDATTKDLVATHPEDWLDYLGLSHEAVEIRNPDLSTVTAAADEVLYVSGPKPRIVQLGLQASHDAELADRKLLYNVLVKRQYGLPVRTVIVLLRREADGPELTGELLHVDEEEEGYLWFRYRVVRLWEQPVEALLTGGLGTLPLAPLARVTRRELPGVIRRMRERLAAEAEAAEAARLWTSAYVLMGLRYPEALTQQLLRGVTQMEESVTYQAIKREGRAEEAQVMLLMMGSRRLGEPSAAERASVEAIIDLPRLEALGRRVFDVESWAELLAE